jgi:hypothetical protein
MNQMPRHTSIRIEELLELPHYSLIQYQALTAGDRLGADHPSKTDAERLLVISSSSPRLCGQSSP